MQKMDIVSAQCAESKTLLTVWPIVPLMNLVTYLLSLGVLPMMYLFGLPLEKLLSGRVKTSLLGTTSYGNG